MDILPTRCPPVAPAGLVCPLALWLVLYGGGDRFSHLVGARLSAEVARQVLSRGDHLADRGMDAIGGGGCLRCVVLAAEPGQQHLPRDNHGVGIRNVAAGDVGCRAMGRLRHRLPLAHAQSRRQPEATDQPGADVGEDVAELVGGHHHIEMLRRHHELHRDRVDHHLLERNIGIFARDFAALLREHAAGKAIDRLLVRGGHLLARTGAGDLERLARDPVRALAGDHPHGDGDVVVGAELRQARDHGLGIEHAFGELAQEHDIHVLVDRRDRGVRERWPRCREQIELLAHRRHHPGGVPARIGGVPDRPHHPAVKPAQRLLGHRRQRVAVLLMTALADRQLLPCDLEPLARGGGLHDLDAFGNNLEADVVAEQDSDTQGHSSTVMPRSSTSCFQLAISSRSQPLGSSSQACGGTTMPPRANASCSAGTVIAFKKA